jgi:hypothetical protein
MDTSIDGIGMLKGNLTRLGAEILSEASAANAPSWATAGLRSIVADLSTAITFVENARTSLPVVAQNPNLSDSYKAGQLAAIIGEAEQSATGKLQAAQSSANTLRAALQRALLPERPRDVTDALVLDRKADLSALLGLQSDGNDMMLKAVELAKRAITEGDALTLYVIAGGPMQFFYEAHSLDTAFLAERFAAVSDKSAIATVYERFHGRDSVPAIVLMAQSAVDMAVQEIHETYDDLIDRLTSRAVAAAKQGF